MIIYALLSRVFGFGMVMTKEESEIVNETRHGNQYIYEDLENVINIDSAENPKLTKYSFIATFEYGESAEGYWSYECMTFQMEDCIYCLKLIHSQYDFIFLFDYSCGHGRGKENGLNANRMNVVFSDKQTKVHNTLINEEAVYLGKFKGSIRPVAVQ